MNNTEERKKCNRCHVNLPLSHFNQKRNGDYGKQCKQCNERQKVDVTCEHGKRRQNCKECKGGSVCIHDNIKSRCRACKGNGICEHDRRKSNCRECNGGSICEHNRQRSYCKECKGGSICEHGNYKSRCSKCNPSGYLKQIISLRIYHSLKSLKSKNSLEYLGCTIAFFKKHIEQQFTEGMAWDNYGKWEIDHIVPLMYGNPTIKQVAHRLHWTNTQPLWKEANNSKRNSAPTWQELEKRTRFLVQWGSD